ncbi:hypothetical protein [Halovivax limisalsi]|uniref:hypothetical protein n=1 Tax=Halovivax limisalsi TaxID=1453760 RepID=UPI001FFC7F78|nr:hypothetical protein [Halovivax limisalsi]
MSNRTGAPDDGAERRCDSCGAPRTDDGTVLVELEGANLDRTLSSRSEASAIGGESIASLFEGADAHHLCADCRSALAAAGTAATDRAGGESEAIDEHWALPHLIVAGFTVLTWYFLLSVPFRFQVGQTFALRFAAVAAALWLASIVLRRALDMRRLSAAALVR